MIVYYIEEGQALYSYFLGQNNAGNLGNVTHLSMPQFPHLYCENNNNSTNLIILL